MGKDSKTGFSEMLKKFKKNKTKLIRTIKSIEKYLDDGGFGRKPKAETVIREQTRGCMEITIPILKKYKEEILEKSPFEITFTSRTRNMLYSIGTTYFPNVSDERHFREYTIGELITLTADDIAKCYNCGIGTLREIEQRLEELGLTLKKNK